MAQSNQDVKDKTTAYLSVSDWHSYVILLRNNPQFGRLWLAGVISHIGNWFNYIGIFVLLTKLTGSGHAISWFLIAKFIPTTIFGPAAGVIADRFSRKTIMIASDLSRAIIVLGFLLIRKPEHVWAVYVLALLQETIWTFYDPARRASVPNLCSREELNLASALGGATWSVMLAVGAALGGFVTAYLGWHAAIVIDSLTFLASAWMLTGLKLPIAAAEEEESVKKEPTWRDYTGLADLVEGSKYVAANRDVAALLLVKSGWALSGGILVMLTIFGEQVFVEQGRGGGSGVLYSIRGIGAAIGPILAWRLLGETKKAMYRAIGLSFFVASGAYIMFSQATGFVSAAPFVLIGHLGGSVQWIFSTNLLQKRVPDQFRGRVFAAEMALLTLVLSLSTYFTGAALDHGLDPRLVLLRLATMFLLPGTLWMVYVMVQYKKLSEK